MRAGTTMMLEEVQHRHTRWQPCLQPVLDPRVETGLEVVFVPEAPGFSKYAWPVRPLLLQALSEDAVSLDRPRLRRMLRSAMDEDRKPSRGPRTAGERIVDFLTERL